LTTTHGLFTALLTELFPFLTNPSWPCSFKNEPSRTKPDDSYFRAACQRACELTVFLKRSFSRVFFEFKRVDLFQFLQSLSHHPICLQATSLACADVQAAFTEVRGNGKNPETTLKQGEAVSYVEGVRHSLFVLINIISSAIFLF
jgi:hypothetical protein